MMDNRIDVTDQERLADLRSELMHVSRISAMGEMAAELAHELNQPLAATVNFLGAAEMLLKCGADRERVQEFVRMATAQAQRAGEIIRRIRHVISRSAIDAVGEPLAEIIMDAVAIVNVGDGQHNIRLDHEFDPASRRVLADRIRIRQVLVHLLRNAVEEVRTMPADKRLITIASKKEAPGMIEISVSDSGPGLPVGPVERFGTPFASAEGGGAVRVGLSIARRIVDAHGGKLKGENKDGGGAIFRFTLPEARDEIEHTR